MIGPFDSVVFVIVSSISCHEDPNKALGRLNIYPSRCRCHLDRDHSVIKLTRPNRLHCERPVYGTMRRDLTALIAAVGLASASQTVFSIHDDIDAFPQV